MLHVARKIAAFPLGKSVDVLGRALNALDATGSTVERVCFALSALEGRVLGAAAPELALDFDRMPPVDGVPASKLVGVTDPGELASRIGSMYGSRAGAG